MTKLCMCWSSVAAAGLSTFVPWEPIAAEKDWAVLCRAVRGSDRRGWWRAGLGDDVDGDGERGAGFGLDNVPQQLCSSVAGKPRQLCRVVAAGTVTTVVIHHTISKKFRGVAITVVLQVLERRMRDCCWASRVLASWSRSI